MKHAILLALIFLVCGLICPKSVPGAQSPAKAKWWSGAITKRLAKAAGNRAEIETALQQTPKEQRDGMAFLIANMPLGKGIARGYEYCVYYGCPEDMRGDCLLTRADVEMAIRLLSQGEPLKNPWHWIPVTLALERLR